MGNYEKETFTEWATRYLLENGFMLRRDVEQVISNIDKSLPSMNGRWGDTVQEYPLITQKIFRMAMDDCIIDFVDGIRNEEQPQP